MQFRLRPSSKKSNNTDISHVQFLHSRSLVPLESPLPRSLGARIDQLEASFSTLQETFKRERQISNGGYVQSQKRLDKVEFKIFSAEQEIRQLNEIRQLKPPRQMVAQSGGESFKNDMLLLKQVVVQEKDAQRQLASHQNAQLQQLGLKMLRQEQQIREMITEQRSHWDQRLHGQEQQSREVESLKNRKMEQQYEMMKGVIANAQRKIYEELQRKIRNETIIKDYVQERIAQVKQQFAGQHRQTLATEAKFIKETKQSLETLFHISSATKKELSEELSETQKLTTGSIKRISMALDISREKSGSEVKEALQLHRQVTNQLVQLRNFVTSRLDQNRQFMNQFQQQTLQRIEQGGGGSNSSSRVGRGVDDQRLSLFQKQINQWKSITEQKNLNVFKEISNTLKTIKLQWRKQNDELVSQVAALNDSLKTIKKAGPNELKKSIQALVSIFNNEFDVLADELQTLTDMIAIAKKQHEKQFKSELNKTRAEMENQMTLSLAQKGKESALYADRIVSRSEQSMKTHMGREIKFANEALAQKVDKNQSSIMQFDTTLKKMNLLTHSQLEEYSMKLKGFNDSYKDYLEEQRKDDMKKRGQLEETMRKNAANMMDIYYKKAQFLVDGLKSNIEVSLMKEKVEASQALQVAKNELKKDVQGARQEWHKQLTQGLQQMTKQRQASQQMLQQTVDQSINNAKRNLTNEIGNSKLEMEQKLNELSAKQEQKQKDREQQHLDLKNTVLQMIRDEKKLTQQKILNNRQETQATVNNLDKNITQHQHQSLAQLKTQKQQLEQYTLDHIAKLEATQKESLDALKNQIERKMRESEQQNKNVSSAQKQELRQLVAAEIGRNNTEQRQEMSQLKASVEERMSQIREETRDKLVSLQQSAKKELTEKQKVQNEARSKQANLQQRVKRADEEMKRADEEMKRVNEEMDVKLKQINVRLDEIGKKMGESQAQAQKDKASTTTEIISRQQQLDKQIVVITKDVDVLNRDTIRKMEEVNKKIDNLQTDAQKKEGEGKQVGESSLLEMRKDVNKSIKKLEQRIQDLQSKERGQQNEEAIANIRKSVNKLEAMVFSEQAKNKALFDRLTEDLNKVSENLAMLANQIRQ